MKNIKRIILGVLLIGTTGAFAQNDLNKITVSDDFNKNQTFSSSQTKAMTPKSIAAKQTKKMVALLGLTPDQTLKVGDLNLKVQEKIAAIKSSDKSAEKKQEFINGNLKDRLNALSSILTETQFVKYKASL